MSREFVPCNREVCPSIKELTGASAIDANIGTELDQVVEVHKAIFERRKAEYVENRDRYALDDVDVLGVQYRMMQDLAAVKRAEQIAAAWRNSQIEAANTVNAINCEAAGTTDCPRLEAALGSIADRFVRVSQVEASPEPPA